jgi:hypothetical protein
MGPLLVVLLQPTIQVSLQFLQCPIDLLPERDTIEFMEHSLMEPFADPVGLRMPGLRSRVIDILDRQIEFILMALWRAAVLGSSICQPDLAESRTPRRTAAPDHSTDRPP